MFSFNVDYFRIGIAVRHMVSMVFSVGSTAAAISGFFADRFGLRSVYLSMSGFFLLSGIMSLYLLKHSQRRLTHKYRS